MVPLSAPHAPTLAAHHRVSADGEVRDHTGVSDSLFLRADPALQVSGHWRSPPGRLLELDVQMGGAGAWIGLHMKLGIPDLSACGWIGFACRGAAPVETMIRPCLRSGTEEGFTDCFFDKHILAGPETRTHVDALDPTTNLEIPETAPWRELILFLPRQDFRLHLHNLHPFVA